jgi:hypothetical protein
MSKSSNPTELQYDRFVETARKLGCDEDPAHFDEILKKVVRHKPVNQTNPKRINWGAMKKLAT